MTISDTKMSTEEIIKKALDKAEKQGYTGWGLEVEDWGKTEQANVLMLIFSHDFAKAFWGEKEIEWEVECEPLDRQYSVYEPMHAPAWRHHLQNMVLESNPPGYLESFI